MWDKGEVKVRKQETVEKGVQCFRCRRMGYYKWKCSNIKEEKKKRSKEAAHVVSLQKVQQEERLVHFLWRKTVMRAPNRKRFPMHSNT